MARGSCRCPSWVRCNTAAERFVLGLVQVSDLECIAQFWDAGCRRIEQVVRLRGDANGLSLWSIKNFDKGCGCYETYPGLNCGAFVCQETEIEMSRLSAVEGETVSALGWIGLHEVLQEQVLEKS